MKTVRSIAAMIVVAALALFVYDFYKQLDRNQAIDEAASIREQTKLLQQQATQMNQQLRQANDEAAALKNEVAGQRRDDAERKQQALIAGYLAEGLQVAQAAKTAVAESYQVNVKLPATNQEAGLPEPSQMRAGSLRSVRLSGKGILTLTYDEKSGVDRGVIKLIPEVRANGLSWRCESASYATIATLVPQCTYTGTSQTE